jgi:hypothetical protein
MAERTEAEHTPGPWGLNERGLIVGPSGECVLFSGPTLILGNHPECAVAEANDRLAVAAPDLLEALGLAEDVMQAAARCFLGNAEPPDSTALAKAILIAGAALAKARGER